MKVIASQDVSFRISDEKDKLELKIKYPKISRLDYKNNKTIQITILNHECNLLLAAYKIKLNIYHKFSQAEKYSLGQVIILINQISKYRFQLTLDEEIETNQIKSTKNTIHNKKITRVGLFTSQPN